MGKYSHTSFPSLSVHHVPAQGSECWHLFPLVGPKVCASYYCIHSLIAPHQELSCLLTFFLCQDDLGHNNMRPCSALTLVLGPFPLSFNYDTVLDHHLDWSVSKQSLSPIKTCISNIEYPESNPCLTSLQNAMSKLSTASMSDWPWAISCRPWWTIMT